MITQTASPVRSLFRRRWLAVPVAAVAVGATALVGIRPAAADAVPTVSASCNQEGNVVLNANITYSVPEDFPVLRLVHVLMWYRTSPTTVLSVDLDTDLGDGDSTSLALDLEVQATDGGVVEFAMSNNAFDGPESEPSAPFGALDCSTSTTTATPTTDPGGSTTTHPEASTPAPGSSTETAPPAPAAQSIAAQPTFTG